MYNNGENSSAIISAGILPNLYSLDLIPLNEHSQILNLIGNTLCFLNSSRDYKLKFIKIYVCNYKLAGVALRQFEMSGLGQYVINCGVKNMGPHLRITAEITLYKCTYIPPKL